MARCEAHRRPMVDRGEAQFHCSGRDCGPACDTHTPRGNRTRLPGDARESRARRRTKPELTPAERSLRARMAAYTLHAHSDPRETTQAARDAFLARFEHQVDPDRRLPEGERRRRAEAAKKAYFTALALKSSRARRAQRERKA